MQLKGSSFKPVLNKVASQAWQSADFFSLPGLLHAARRLSLRLSTPQSRQHGLHQFTDTPAGPPWHTSLLPVQSEPTSHRQKNLAHVPTNLAPLTLSVFTAPTQVTKPQSQPTEFFSSGKFVGKGTPCVY